MALRDRRKKSWWAEITAPYGIEDNRNVNEERDDKFGKKRGEDSSTFLCLGGLCPEELKGSVCRLLATSRAKSDSSTQNSTDLATSVELEKPTYSSFNAKSSSLSY